MTPRQHSMGAHTWVRRRTDDGLPTPAEILDTFFRWAGTPDHLVEANSVKRFRDEVGLFEEIVLGIGDLVDDQLLETIESFSGGGPPEVYPTHTPFSTAPRGTMIFPQHGRTSWTH